MKMTEKPYRIKDINIRRFCIQDYDEVISLWKQSGLLFKPFGRDSKDFIKKEIAHETALFFVAELQQHIIGTIFATYDGRKGWINRLAVAPPYQRQDLGELLILRIEKIFEEKGIDIVACLIEDWNVSSQKFFQRIGFQRHDDITYFSKRKNDNV
jgi:ribosomal protein S18 acetylase RimI-like enzyme